MQTNIAETLLAYLQGELTLDEAVRALAGTDLLDKFEQLIGYTAQLGDLFGRHGSPTFHVVTFRDFPPNVLGCFTIQKAGCVSLLVWIYSHGLGDPHFEVAIVNPQGLVAKTPMVTSAKEAAHQLSLALAKRRDVYPGASPNFIIWVEALLTDLAEVQAKALRDV
jgi:hypothetical protein